MDYDKLISSKAYICPSCKALVQEHYIMSQSGQEKREKCGVCGKTTYCKPYSLSSKPKKRK